MEVILHIGAHRTGTTSFQNYVRAHRTALDAQEIGFWGPWRTRTGLLDGLADRAPGPKQARRMAGRVRMNVEAAARKGKVQLIVSDENLIGTCRKSLRAGRLYPDVGERMARVHAGFGEITKVSFQIRSLELWWASALAFLLPRGGSLPDAALLDRLTDSPRSWRHVIADIACACPGAEIAVTPFERYAGRPDSLLRQMTGQPAPPTHPGEHWANRSADLAALRVTLAERGEDPDQLPGEGRWMPFSPEQAMRLRETYADDLFWLRAGADGLAKLTEDDGPQRPGINPGPGQTRRGHDNDRSARRLAPTR